MSYNPVPTVSTGDTWSAANHNTYVRDNFAAGVPDIFTAAGDIAYATAANAASQLAIGSVGQILKTSASSIPAWENIISSRQGGSSTDYAVAGTTDYTVNNPLIQIGAFNIPKFNSSSGKGTVTFQEAYSMPPIVFVSNLEYVGITIMGHSITTTNFEAYYNGSDLTLGADIAWIAIGESA